MTMKPCTPSLRWPVRRLAAGAMLVALVGCAAPLPSAPLKAATPEYRYQIGTGDLLKITVLRSPELSADVPVRPDGKMSSPYVEDVIAVGKSPAELAREIESQLAKYVREPQVSVTVLRFEGVGSEQVRVVGAGATGKNAVVVPYRQNMTLLDVMIAAGSMSEYASGNRAVLVRGRENNKQYSVRLRDLLKSADMTANVDMLPGDVILIPEGWY